jgi:membrane carboxypeptidase/penicillin-binding protein
MLHPTNVVRLRRHRQTRSSWRGGITSGLIIFIAILASATVLIFALMYADLTEGLPRVQEIEHVFGSVGWEEFKPVRIYDQSGEILLFEVINPSAAERRWLKIDPLAIDVLPHHVVQASILALDDAFWENPGYDHEALLQVLIGSLLNQSELGTTPTIAERLVETHLLPLGDSDNTPIAEVLRRALLSAELTRRYPKELILEWYLNSAHYGNFAYGIDAAALVYFGKHAYELTLAESTLLASIPQDPTINPIDAPSKTRELQIRLLNEMASQGLIQVSEAREAVRESTTLQSMDGGLTSYVSDFALYVWTRLGKILDPNALHRSGLRVITSLDNDLQLQTACVAQTHLKRMSGGEVGFVESAEDGTACVAAGLLPPLRPSDAMFDHNLSDVAIVVIDPTTGFILSFLGPTEVPRESGSLLMPFTYLTAFARGYSPSTMVLDIPEPQTFAKLSWDVPLNDDGQDHGPVRMRTALANSYNVAAARSLMLVGVENVLPILRSMGVTTLAEPGVDSGPLLASGSAEVTLLDLAFSYGVVANGGQMVGMAAPSEGSSLDVVSLDPVAIIQVENASGRVIYNYAQEERAVLSQQLSYLFADVLSDEAARWPAFGHPNPFEIGRPAGVKNSTTIDGYDNWTIGFAPSHLVGVWIGNLDDSPMRQMKALNGATPIWHAVIRYATRDTPREGWVLPPGMSLMEVCDPSGLLPTQYCPNVVREVFMQGTEPTHYDNLYQPFLINKETNKLATLNTPLEYVEERVYMIPPPEAVEWARQVGIEGPPQEYDTQYEGLEVNPEVNFKSPLPFDILRGELILQGNARPEAFQYYRLQYGRGLNPSRWIQIGEDKSTPVSDGVLGRWDTEGLNGLYTLQLLVVQSDGRIATAATYVTIDNQPPQIQLLSPESGKEYNWPEDREVVIEVEVFEEVSLEKVVFYVDNRPIDTVTSPPYSSRWQLGLAGEHTVYVRVIDVAGNQTESERVTITIVR